MTADDTQTIASSFQEVRDALMLRGPYDARAVAALDELEAGYDALEAALAETRRERDGSRAHANEAEHAFAAADQRAEAAEAEVERLRQALRLAYPYMKDALEEAGMTDEIEALIRADIEVVAAALASGSEGGADG